MRVIFAGSPSFAVSPLEAVARGHQICGVLTNPDRRAGRNRQAKPTPIKVRALELGLPVFQPSSLDQGFTEQLRALRPDILVVVAFGKIFRKGFIDIFPRGGVNLHPSLLPKYRGAAPIPAVILAGECQTGITVQRLALKMDAGNILAAEKIPLKGSETTGSLCDILFPIGARLLVSCLAAIGRGNIRETRQKEGEATYCRLIGREDGRIDWRDPASKIERMIRAYDPWPGAFTVHRGRILQLWRGGVYPGSIDSGSSRQGTVLGVDNRYGILINTGAGVLYVSKLQLQSKKLLDWGSFLNGQQDFIGSLLGGDS